MIKNLLNADEEIAPPQKEIIEQSVIPPVEAVPPTARLDESLLAAESPEVFEIPPEAVFFKIEPEKIPVPDRPFSEPERIFPTDDRPAAPAVTESVENLFADETEPEMSSADQTDFDIFPQIEFKPPSRAETIRQSGLAWSAGIIFFGSVVFMLILGWFADLLMGTSPWGLVGGIILGSIIGFVQFFRVTAQIFKKN